MGNWQRTLKLSFQYLIHQFTAKNEHGIHSPFLFNLYTQVLSVSKRYYAFDDIDSLRERLTSDSSVIEVNDFGAGSYKMPSSVRKISRIAQYTTIAKAQGELLFRLINYSKPQVVVELGTSLGLGTLYIQLANKDSKVITFEGCNNTLAIAQKHFESFSIAPELVLGNIDFTLEKHLTTYSKIDFVYMDANHSYKATLNYFNILLPKLHEESIIMVDDIRWSDEMLDAWKEMINFKEVTLSLDFFSFGILFFRQKHPQQHFKLKL